MEKRNVNILLVDDDKDDFFITSEYLKEIKSMNFNIDYASTYEQGVEEINRNVHDVMFFDFLLGARTGLDLIRKAQEAYCDAPIILLTGKGDLKTDMEAMRLGASDYLIKSELDSEKLDRSIRYALERSAALKALKKSEEKFRTIFERTRDMIYITNDHGDLIEFNDSATRILGYSREELQKLNVSDLYYSAVDRNTFIEAMNKTGVISNYEVKLKHKSGELKYCLISGTLQHGPDGKSIFYQGIIHDITRRKKIEKDLIIAEKLAVSGRVVRTLAHEIRNPLTNVNLSVEELESQNKDEELSTYYDIIKRNIKRINDLLSELLHSAKPVEINKVPHSLNNLIDKTLEHAMDRISLKNINLVKELSSDDIIVNVDEAKMRMAILNLIINAVEATSEKSGILRIRTEKKYDKSLITVEDNGKGIPPEDLGRLFEPYFTGKHNGLGLGLATTHNIIKSHNSTIDVESKLGVGTKFTITIEENI